MYPTRDATRILVQNSLQIRIILKNNEFIQDSLRVFAWCRELRTKQYIKGLRKGVSIIATVYTANRNPFFKPIYDIYYQGCPSFHSKKEFIAF